MFLTTENYLAEIKSSIANSSNILAAIAFWGDGAEALFLGWNGENLQIICNLSSGATNPQTIRNLMNKIPKEKLTIRNSSTLHAKTIIFQKSLITGSANFSSNGLGLESEESAYWQEAGLLSTGVKEIDSAKAWFSDVWKNSDDITELMLKEADEDWKKRQHNRPKNKISTSLLSQNLVSLRNRPITIIVYRDTKISDHSHQYTEAVKNQFISQNYSNEIAELLSCYEGWDTLPDETFIISFRFPKKGKIFQDGIWKRLKYFDYNPAEEESHASVQIVKKEQLVDGYELTLRDSNLISDRLKTLLNDKTRGFFSKQINLYDFLKENQDLIYSN